MREHYLFETCKDYLPKAKRKNKGLVAQCSFCGCLYTCTLNYDYHWTPLKETSN